MTVRNIERAVQLFRAQDGMLDRPFVFSRCCLLCYAAMKTALGYFKSFRYTTPPFITDFTRSISVMSSSGFGERVPRSIAVHV